MSECSSCQKNECICEPYDVVFFQQLFRDLGKEPYIEDVQQLSKEKGFKYPSLGFWIAQNPEKAQPLGWCQEQNHQYTVYGICYKCEKIKLITQEYPCYTCGQTERLYIIPRHVRLPGKPEFKIDYSSKETVLNSYRKKTGYC